MQKVMGGEFLINNNLFEKTIMDRETIIYSSGRNALFNILYNEYDFDARTILIPNYLCDSVTRTINDAGWSYKFYRINIDLEFDIDEIIKCEDINAVLVINYFGVLKLDEAIKKIRKARQELVIIEDDVQAFFEYKKSEAEYSFTSLRKWFPCPDGAFINTKRELKTKIAVESKWSQYKLAGNLLKNYCNVVDDSICLELLKKGEELLDMEYNSVCSEVSQEIYAHIDTENVANIRKKNARFLHENLLKLGVRHIYCEDAVPLFIPIFIENRDILRKHFFETNIFTPVHWQMINDEWNGDSQIYNLELSLICDQRYDIEDMKRQINVLEHFLDEEETGSGNTNN